MPDVTFNTHRVEPQLDLFATGMHCCHCGDDPGRSPSNGLLWNGFLDKATGQYVCMKCKQVHYMKKYTAGNGKTEHLEFPVMVDHKMFDI